MRMAKIALFLIMLSFVSSNKENSIMEHCCLSCYMCEYFDRTDIEFFSLDME